MSTRLRFALTCALVFLALGGLVTVTVYLVVRQSLEYRNGLLTPESIRIDGRRTFPRLDDYEVARHRAMQVRVVYQRDTLANVRTAGLVGIPAGTAAAFGLGWWASGWVLRPFRKVTEAARRVAQNHDLTQRIAYGGAREE